MLIRIWNRTSGRVKGISRFGLLIALASAVIGVAILSPGTANAAEPADTSILAIVNSDTITTANMDQEIMRRHADMSDSSMKSFDFRKLLKKMVDDRLIIQEARALDMQDEESLTSQLTEVRLESAMRLFIKENFHPDLTVPHSEVLRIFNKNYGREQLRTVAVSSRQQALDLIAKIKNGASMDSIARTTSLDTRKDKGGLHNFSYWADIEEPLRGIADTLKLGGLSSPFEFRGAYAFLRVEKRADPDTADFVKYGERIEAILKNAKKDKAWAEFRDSLKKEYPAQQNDKVLAAIKADGPKLFTNAFMTGTEDYAFKIDDQHQVTDDALRKEISHTAMTNGQQPFDTLFSLGVSNLTAKMVLGYAAEKAGFLNNPEVARQYQESLDSSLIESYIKEMVVSKIVFNHQEFQDYYDSHKDDFREDPQVQLAQIQVMTKDSADEIYSRLQEGANFDYLMKTYDADNEMLRKPIDWITLGQFPKSIKDEIDKMKIGDYGHPYQTVSGWLIFQMRGRRLGRQKTIDEVDMQIRQIMFQNKFNDLLDANLSTLKANSTIVYRDKNVDRYFGND